MAMKTENDFQARMAAGKAAAELELHRDRGGSTVRVYATTTAMHADRDPAAFRSESQARWEFAVSDFLEGLRFDLFGEQWEGL